VVDQVSSEVHAGIVWRSLFNTNPGALTPANLMNAMVSMTVGLRDGNDRVPWLGAGAHGLTTDMVSTFCDTELERWFGRSCLIAHAIPLRRHMVV